MLRPREVPKVAQAGAACLQSAGSGSRFHHGAAVAQGSVESAAGELSRFAAVLEGAVKPVPGAAMAGARSHQTITFSPAPLTCPPPPSTPVVRSMSPQPQLCHWLSPQPAQGGDSHAEGGRTNVPPSWRSLADLARLPRLRKGSRSALPSSTPQPLSLHWGGVRPGRWVPRRSPGS